MSTEFRETDFIAHYRERDGRIQSVETHLLDTAALAQCSAGKLGLQFCGRLLGLIHDFGKYSDAFQIYIREGCGFYGEEGRKRAEAKRGTIDHATAGAQIIWQRLPDDRLNRSLAQILSVALMSHHSSVGMTDFISLDGTSPFLKRLAKPADRTHLDQAREKSNPQIREEIEKILTSPELRAEFKSAISALEKAAKGKTATLFYYSLLTRFLFSCLLDADRTNTADFEKAAAATLRSSGKEAAWDTLANTLDRYLAGIKTRNRIDEIRTRISQECLAASTRKENIFTLTVPTGGGKTLASLRFALHRAAQRPKGSIHRIIYILPYTTIIEQNASQVRDILGDDVVLEHHSNIVPEIDTWRNRVLSENWDAPIVFTTSVQFLNCLFEQTTGSARRMHQLTNAILIFDEIQSLPIKTIHCFNHAINFLTSFCNSTAVLCTATQPLLGKVNPALGALNIGEHSEIISDKQALFKNLKRTEIIDKRRDEKWSYPEIAEFAMECLDVDRTVLIVCNLKSAAFQLYKLLKENPNTLVVHLSTSMCPAHRREKINKIRESLKTESGNIRPVICVSTQLIEAGVDLDFGCVIRSLAGMDSITQAGGRCNRNGNKLIGHVHVLNFADEYLGAALKEIQIGQDVGSRILGEYARDPGFFDDDLLSEKTMDRFYQYYFHQRSPEMLYPLKAGKGNPPLPKDTSILDLLTENKTSQERAAENTKTLPLKSAYSTAAQGFNVIDAPTRGILVPHGDTGTKLISDLAAAFSSEEHPLNQQISLLKTAQQYTVNCFPHAIEKLSTSNAIREVQPDSNIYYLDERHYHDELGVTLEALSEQNFLNVP